MKTNFLKLSLLALVMFTASCSNDDDDTPIEESIPEVVVQKVVSLETPASGTEYAKFSFSENKIVTTDKWDIGFNATTIIVNGGVKVVETEPKRIASGAISIVSGAFDSVKTFPLATTFKQDGPTAYAIPTGMDNGWYSYSMATHTILPLAGKVFVVKTHDGKYAKFEVLNYYKDAPAVPTSADTPRYYTFNFAYQANSTTTF